MQLDYASDVLRSSLTVQAGLQLLGFFFYAFRQLFFVCFEFFRHTRIRYSYDLRG